MITRRIACISLLLLSTSVIADANDGEYLGFTLGSKFYVPEGAIGRHHITGALVYFMDPHQRHQHIGSLSVFVSPKSSIIGGIFGDWYFSSKRSAEQFSVRHMQTLETKYGNWKRRRNTLSHGDYEMWLDLEQKPPIVEHWPSDKKFRVSVALVFAPDSTAKSAWMAKVMSEAGPPEPRR